MPQRKPIGILLVNIGTPDSPEVADVRRYLREFLSDPRVIDIPAPLRWLLLNLIILPTRPKRSAKAYQKIWTPEGSPLLIYGAQLAQKLEAHFGADKCQVRLGMHYGNPSIDAAFEAFSEAGIDDIIVVPLYPQYSAAATGSAIDRVMAAVKDKWVIPNLHFIPPFFDHPAFIEALVQTSREALQNAKPDHILMSYHGVPERHCTKTDTGGAHCQKSETCCDELTQDNRNCYRAQCFETTRQLVKALDLDPAAVSTSFQSRLGRTPWIQPYTDELLTALGEENVKHLMVLEPSFITDCLETLEEIAMEGQASFKAAGGEAFTLLPCLNAQEPWVEALAKIITSQNTWLQIPTQTD